jgi:hypothetical protein
LKICQYLLRFYTVVTVFGTYLKKQENFHNGHSSILQNISASMWSTIVQLQETPGII